MPTDGWSACRIGVALVRRGVVAQFDGDPQRTEQSLWEAVRRVEGGGRRFSLAIALTEASEIVEMYGDYDEAHDMLAHGIELSERVGFFVEFFAIRVAGRTSRRLRRDDGRTEADPRLDLLKEIADEAIPWARRPILLIRPGGERSPRRTQQWRNSRSSWIEQAWAISRSLGHADHPRRWSWWGGVTRPTCSDAHELAVETTNATGWRSGSPVPSRRGLANSMEGLAGALGDRTRFEPPRLGPPRAGRRRQGSSRRSGGAMPPTRAVQTSTAPSGVPRRSMGDQAFEAESAIGANSEVEDVLDVVSALLPSGGDARGSGR